MADTTEVTHPNYKGQSITVSVPNEVIKNRDRDTLERIFETEYINRNPPPAAAPPKVEVKPVSSGRPSFHNFAENIGKSFPSGYTDVNKSPMKRMLEVGKGAWSAMNPKNLLQFGPGQGSLVPPGTLEQSMKLPVGENIDQAIGQFIPGAVSSGAQIISPKVGAFARGAAKGAVEGAFGPAIPFKGVPVPPIVASGAAGAGAGYWMGGHGPEGAIPGAIAGATIPPIIGAVRGGIESASGVPWLRQPIEPTEFIPPSPNPYMQGGPEYPVGAQPGIAPPGAAPRTGGAFAMGPESDPRLRGQYPPGTEPEFAAPSSPKALPPPEAYPMPPVQPQDVPIQYSPREGPLGLPLGNEPKLIGPATSTQMPPAARVFNMGPEVQPVAAPKPNVRPPNPPLQQESIGKVAPDATPEGGISPQQRKFLLGEDKPALPAEKQTVTPRNPELKLTDSKVQGFAIKRPQGITQEDLQTQFGASKEEAFKTLQDMVDSGTIVRRGYKYYDHKLAPAEKAGKKTSVATAPKEETAPKKAPKVNPPKKELEPVEEGPEENKRFDLDYLNKQIKEGNVLTTKQSARRQQLMKDLNIEEEKTSDASASESKMTNKVNPPKGDKKSVPEKEVQDKKTEEVEPTKEQPAKSEPSKGGKEAASTKGSQSLDEILKEVLPEWKPGTQIKYSDLKSIAEKTNTKPTVLGNHLAELGYDIEPSKFGKWGLKKPEAQEENLSSKMEDSLVESTANKIFSKLGDSTTTFSKLKQMPEFSKIPHEIFEKAAEKLQKDKKALMSLHSYQYEEAMTPDERANAVKASDGKYYVSIYKR